MDSLFGDLDTIAAECARNATIAIDPLMKCTQSRLGNQWQHAYAVQTEQTKPTQSFVPWVTLNGEHTDEIQDMAQTDLVQLLCDSYKVEYRTVSVLSIEPSLHA